MERTRDLDDARFDTRCRHCGAYVSRKFTQVFGDNNDEVYACMNCTSMRELVKGAAVPE